MDLAERAVLLKPVVDGLRGGDPILCPLRPVLSLAGIASIVIHVITLATPLF